MKKILLVSLFAMGLMTAVDAQEISENQWQLVSKKTADWCTFCGSWGWTFKNNLISDLANENAVIWALHYDGGLETPTAKAIASNFGSSGQPVFYLNTDNMGVFSSNVNAKRAEFLGLVQSLNLFAPFAGVGANAVYSDNSVVSTSRVKFLEELEGGDFYLASYLVQKELIAFQASQGNSAKHTNILLHSFDGSNFFGKLVSSGAVAKDQEFVVEHDIELAAFQQMENYYVVTILWAKVDDTYTPVNLNRQELQGVSNTKDFGSKVEISAFHSFENNVEVKISSNTALEQVDLNLIDINGKLLSSLKSITLQEGEQVFQLPVRNLPLGTYIINLASPNATTSMKVVMR